MRVKFQSSFIAKIQRTFSPPNYLLRDHGGEKRLILIGSVLSRLEDQFGLGSIILDGGLITRSEVAARESLDQIIHKGSIASRERKTRVLGDKRFRFKEILHILTSF